MKRCLKSDPEPSCLSSFRTVNPDGDWDLFKESRDAYTELVDRLRSDQRGLCTYCEAEAPENNRQVAHFHPKSDRDGSTNWALTWSNLWMCCKGGTQTWLAGNEEEFLPPLPENRSCDENKMDKVLDGVILRPDGVPAFPRIFRYRWWTDEVHIEADDEQCVACGIDPRLAENTIEELNLNCRRLGRARHRVLKILQAEMTELRKARRSLPETHLSAKWLGVQGSGHYRKFFTAMRWQLRDAGAEAFLHASGFKG